MYLHRSSCSSLSPSLLRPFSTFQFSIPILTPSYPHFPNTHHRISFSSHSIMSQAPLPFSTTSPQFFPHFHPLQAPLRCLLFRSYTTRSPLLSRVTPLQFSISSPYVLEDFPIGVCLRLFEHSIIYTHPHQPTRTPLSPSCIDSRVYTDSLASHDINSRRDSNVGAFQIEIRLESSNYPRRLRSSFRAMKLRKDRRRNEIISTYY